LRYSQNKKRAVGVTINGPEFWKGGRTGSRRKRYVLREAATQSSLVSRKKRAVKERTANVRGQRSRHVSSLFFCQVMRKKPKRKNH